MKYLIFIIWIFYAIIEGWREARYWYYKFENKDYKDYAEHDYFAYQRSIVMGLIGGSLLYYTFWKTFLYIFLYAISFPFWHDGMYYWQRNQLDNKIYKRKWFDQSQTSSAFFTRYFTPIVRTLAFVISLILMIII